MLNQQRSGTSARLKYLIAAPVFAGLLCASTLAFSKDYGWIDLDPANALTRLEALPPIMPAVSTATHQGKIWTISNNKQATEVNDAPVKFMPSTLKWPVLIIIDGKIAYPKANETVVADSMTDVPPNTAWAIKKWGNKAKNGVRIFSGNAQIIKKSAYQYVDFDKFGGRIGTSNLRNGQELYDPKTLYIVNGKKQSFNASQIKAKTMVSMSCDSMVIYDKDNEYAHNKWGNDAGRIVVLKGEHASVNLVNWSDTKTKSDTAVFNQFYKEMAQNIHYPAIARSSNTTGKVFAIFSVDDNGILQRVQIVRGIANSVNEEVFRAIKASSAVKKMPGLWVVPVNFTLSYEEDSAPDLSVTLPPSETEKKTFDYNPNHTELPRSQLKMLDEIVIRGYVKSKNN